MAFQSSAFQGSAFQTEIPAPPEPSAPSGGIPATLEPVEIRGFARVKLYIRVTATGTVGFDEEDLRRRVRDYLASLLG